MKFVNETIHNFEKEHKELIIPEWLFEAEKTLTLRFPYSSASKKFFTKKKEGFINDQINLIRIWNTHKVQSLFNNKNKVQHHSYVVYYSLC